MSLLITFIDLIPCVLKICNCKLAKCECEDQTDKTEDNESIDVQIHSFEKQINLNSNYVSHD